MCERENVPFRDRKAAGEIKNRYALAISWRWIIDAGESELIVLHDSLLPRYRGFNPLVSMLINGEDRVGVTTMFATEEYDRGRVIGQSSTAITYPMKIQRAIDLVAANYADLVLGIARTLAAGGELESTPQDESRATYSLWRDEDDYHIDWTWDADRIKRFADAVGHPYKGAVARLDGRTVRVRDCDVVEDIRIENRSPRQGGLRAGLAARGRLRLGPATTHGCRGRRVEGIAPAAAAIPVPVRMSAPARGLFVFL